MDAAIAYEEQIVRGVRRLPSHKRLEVLRIIQRMEREVVEDIGTANIDQICRYPDSAIAIPKTARLRVKRGG